MKKTLLLAAALIAVFGLLVTACNEESSGGASYTDNSPVLATVNGSKVTVDDFKADMASLPPYVAQTLSNPQVRDKFLDNLIDRKLLIQEARKEGLDKDPEIQKKISMFVDSLLLQKVLGDELSKATVSDKDAREYFDKNKANLGSVRISHIQVGSEAEAKDVLAKLKAGESFETLAKKYSQDKETSSKGGDLGYLEWSKMNPSDLRNVAFETPVGDFSNVIKSSFAYHIIKVTDKKPAKESDFAEIEPMIREDLLNKLKNKLIDDKIASLRVGAKITKDEEAMKNLSFLNPEPATSEASAASKPEAGAAKPESGKK